MKMRSLVKNMALVVICSILLTPVLLYEFPFLIGADRSYTVMSGSMSPTIRPGDIIIVKETDPYNIKIGDVLTVESEFTYTHRVVERLDDGLFGLKGDANEEPDQNPVEASQIVGKVILVLPFNHLYTPYGFALMLITPASIFIGKQLHTIHQYTKRRSRRETMRLRRKKHSALDTSTALLALILTVNTSRIIAPHFIAGSSSYFSDAELASGFFHAGVWEITASVDIDPDTLNLDSQGEYVTVYAYVETEYDENNIIVESVTLDGVVQADWGEVNSSCLVVKFDRTSLIEYLIEEGYGDGDEVTLTLSGEFKDGVRFTGEDTIRVVNDEV